MSFAPCYLILTLACYDRVHIIVSKITKAMKKLENNEIDSIESVELMESLNLTLVLEYLAAILAKAF